MTWDELLEKFKGLLEEKQGDLDNAQKFLSFLLEDGLGKAYVDRKGLTHKVSQLEIEVWILTNALRQLEERVPK